MHPLLSDADQDLIVDRLVSALQHTTTPAAE